MRPPPNSNASRFSHLLPTNPPGWSWLFHQMETAAIAFAFFVALTLVVLGFKFEPWVHEWANFLKHYSAASGAARMPVNLVVLYIYLCLFALTWLGRRQRNHADGRAA